MSSIEGFIADLARLEVRLWLEGERLRMSAPKDALNPALWDQLKHRKPEIIAYLQRGSDESAGPLELEPLDRDGELPLSFTQNRLWFLHQLEGGSPAYNIPLALDLRGCLDVARLEAALAALMDRHETLRTAFVEQAGKPLARIHDHLPVPLNLVALEAWDTSRQADLTELLAAQLGQSTFDLTRAPLLRLVLLRFRADHHVLLVNMHHIIADGWSIQVMVRELGTAYRALLAGSAAFGAAPRLQFVDYAQWQRDLFRGALRERQLAWWREQLAELPPLLELPTDRPRPAQQSHRGDQVFFDLEDALSERLQARVAHGDVTLFMLLQAGFALLLARFSGHRDIALGTPIANRDRPEWEALIGFFANTLVLRNDLSGSPDFEALLSRVKQSALDAYAHGSVPFEHIVETLQPERNLSYSPLFQVMFVLREDHMAGFQLPGLRLTLLEPSSQTARFDLTLTITRDGHRLGGIFEFASDLFERASIARLADHYTHLLAAGLAQPNTSVFRLPMVSASERDGLLQRFNQTARDHRHRTGMHQLIAARMVATPDAVAVIDGDTQLSYAELRHRAAALASQLRDRGIGADDLVGVCLQRGQQMVVGLLGTLWAGAAYVPIDPDYPAERLAFMLADAAPAVLLTSPDLLHLSEGFAGTRICLDRAADLPASGDLEPQPVSPDNAIYMIYTSGSTGRPKGVVNSHAAVCNRILWMQHEYGLSEADRVLQKTPYSFDVSAWEFFWTLSAGAGLVMAEPGGHKDPAYLREIIAQAGITTLHFVPSMLMVFLDELAIQPCAPPRHVFCSGEALSAELAARFHCLWPVPLYNLYGPTEAAIDVTAFRCEGASAGETVPIGQPISNVSVHVLDPFLEPSPIGVPGELFIGGVNLARGYRGRPALTAERFVPDPFGEGERLYRSGDLVRRAQAGDITFLGRLDFQVKLRGFRIELGEIEAALSAHPEIHRAHVLLLQKPQPRLVSWLQGSASADALRVYLRDELPAYMVPAEFVHVTDFPLTASGKLDRQALSRIEPERSTPASNFVAPSNERERILAEIWAELLGLQRVSTRDNFFDLGGDSILSMQIRARARDRGLLLTPKQLFQHQTIAALAAAATEGNAGQRRQAPSGPVPLTPIQRWFLDARPINPRHFNQALMLVSPADLDADRLAQVWQRLFLHHDALRSRFSRDADGTWHQQAGPDDRLHLETYAWVPGELSWSTFLAQGAEQLQAGLDPEQGPLIRVALFLRDGLPARHLIVIHHLVVDGVSWRFLLEDLVSLYAQEDPAHARLPEMSDAYGAWSVALAQLPDRPDMIAHATHWQGPTEVAPLPFDHQPGEWLAGDSHEFSWSTCEAETRTLLHDLPRLFRAGIGEALLTALAQALAQWCDTRQAWIDLESHGREPLNEELDLSRTVGWFTSLYPVLLTPGDAGADAALAAVKEQLRAIPLGGIPFGLLKYGGSSAEAERLRDLPAAAVLFNYLGQTDTALPEGQPFRLAGEPPGTLVDPGHRRSHPLEVMAVIGGGCLHVHLSYDRHAFEPASIASFAASMQTHLKAIIARCGAPDAGLATPSDFPLARLDQAQLNTLLGNARGAADLYPLSPMQEGLLFHALADGPGAYFEQLDFVLRADLDVARFQQAWSMVIQRHTVLRTGFRWHDLPRPLQLVAEQVTASWTIEDWRALEPEQQKERLDAFLAQDRARGFALDEAPLLRFALFHLGSDCFHFVWSHHHILLDGWSLPIIFREVFGFYAALQQNRPFAPPAAPPFRDYISWLAEQDMDEAQSWWRAYLDGFDEATQLPRSGDGTVGEPGERTHHLPASLCGELERMARQQRQTLNVLVQAAWARLLGCYADADEVVFGTTVSGRNPAIAAIEDCVGLFINTLPLRVAIDERPLPDWLHDLRDGNTERERYGYAPLARITEWSALPPGQALFGSILVFENYPVDASLREGDLPFEVDHFRGFERTHYPLTLIAVPGEQLCLRLGYQTDHFSAATIERMLHHLEHLLAAMVEQPDKPFARLSPLNDAERQQLLHGFNPSDRAFPDDRVAVQLFAARATHQPDRIAVYHADNELSYGALEARANQLAHHLLAHGAQPGNLIGICLRREPSMIAAMLAVHKLGAAYVPMDPQYPAERLAHYLRDVALVLSDGSTELPAGDFSILDVHDAAIDDQPGAAPVFLPHGELLSHVIYTSGSTGTPKGVALRQRNVLPLVFWARYNLQPADLAGVLASTSICFDLSVFEFFVTLAWGGAVVLADNALALPQHPARERVSLINTVPSAITGLLDAGPLPAATRVVCLAGEALHRDLADRIHAASPVIRLFNLYGPSEDTTYSSAALIERDERSTPPIGQPILGSSAYVLNRHMALAPLGVPGELFLGGAGLAFGYWNDPASSATRFVPNPFAASPGARLYRSGDRVVRRDDGQLVFLGRLDYQVKLRGFRIEPGEIEAALRRCPGIADAVVAVRQRMLVAWVEGAVEEGEARVFLEGRLPQHMLPGRYLVLERLPRTPNSKLDRKHLPEPDRAESSVGYAAPRNTREARLAEIWQKVFGLERVGIHDNFFELGGDSILSIQIVGQARAHQLALDPKMLFRYQSIAELAPHVTASESREEAPATGEVPLTPIQSWFLDAAPPAMHHYNQSLLLDVPADLCPQALGRALFQLVLWHDALRLRFQEGRQFYADRDQLDADSYQPECFRLPNVDAMATVVAGLQQGLDLADGPLLRAGLMLLDEGGARLLLTIHHLVVDGVSWRILLEDLDRAYRATLTGETPIDPPRTASYQSWSLALQQRARDLDEAEIDWWRAQEPHDNIPWDWPEEADRAADQRQLDVTFADLDSARLDAVNRAYRTRMDELLLAALAGAFQAWCGAQHLYLELESHGRDAVPELDTSRSVGWFTALYPVSLTLPNQTDELIKAVKEQLRAVPGNGAGYGLLRYLKPEVGLPTRAADVVFNYLGKVDQIKNELFAAAAESPGPERDPRQQRPHGLEIVAIVSGGCLRVSFRYAGLRLAQGSAQALADAFSRQIRALVAHCLSEQAGGLTPSDVPLAGLSQAELDGLDRRVTDLYPLSPLQEGLLFHVLSAPEGDAYFQQLCLGLRGELDRAAFQGAWSELVQTHAVLRSAFHHGEWDRPLQAVYEPVSVPWHFVDWSQLSEQEVGDALEAYLVQDRARPFRLDTPPLMRFALMRTGSHRFSFVWSFHHLLLDGWSLPLLLKQVMQAYEVLLQRREPKLRGSAPYRDYIQWLQGQDAQAALDHWRARLAEVERPGRFWQDPLAGTAGEPRELSRRLDFGPRLVAFTRKHHLTFNAIMRAAWSLLLRRYGGGPRALFGATVSGRPAELAGVEQMVGLLINTLPVAIPTDDGLELLPWLATIQSQSAEDEGLCYLPLSTITRCAPTPSGEALFDNLLVVENYPLDDALQHLPGGLRVEQMVGHERTNYPVTLAAIPGERPELRLHYRPDHLSQDGAQALLRRLSHLLDEMVNRTPANLGHYDVLDAQERQQILVACNDTTVVYEETEILSVLLANAARRHGDELALLPTDGSAGLTYRELRGDVLALANRLRRTGVVPETVVGLCCQRSSRMVIAMLAIWETGGVFVPLEPKLPDERLAHMVQQTAMFAVLGDPELAARFPASLPFLDLSLASEPGGVLPLKPLPQQLAYICFTSGSTGQPKGVSTTHRGIVNRLEWSRRTSPAGPGFRFLLLASFSFDLIFYEVCGPLLVGSCLVVAPPEINKDTEALLSLVAHHQITHISFVPSLLRVLLDDEDLPVKGACLKEVFVGGETLAPSVRSRFHQLLSARLVHAYGPTENSLSSTVWFSDPKVDVQPIPIGTPHDNTRLHVLDHRLQPVPHGVVGRIFLAGIGLSRGYVGRPRETALRFIPNPHALLPGERLYDSGDLGRYLDLPDQLTPVQFMGRADRQLKVRSYRIEPGEIEAQLLRHPDVQDCFVTVIHQAESPRLTAYVVTSAEPSDALRDGLSAFLAPNLPEHMIPSLMMFLPEWPLNNNGKLDRKRLPVPEAQATDRATVPRNETERRLVAIWSRVLGLSQVSIYDNFFELGGDSILSIQVVTAARREGLHLTPKQVLEAGNIARLATMVATAKALDAVQGPVTGPHRLTPIQHFFFEDPPPNPNRFVQWVGLRLAESADVSLLPDLLSRLQDHHDALRLRFELKDDEVTAAYGPTGMAVPLSIYELSSRTAEGEADVAEALLASLDIQQGPLFAAALVRYPDQARLILVIHHLAVDTVSWRILLEDLQSIWQQALAGVTPQLPDKTTSFQRFSERLDEALRTEELPWWQAATEPSRSNAERFVLADRVSVELNESATAALTGPMHAAYNTRITDVLLCGLSRALLQLGETSVTIALEGHGRETVAEDVELSRTVGWFTTLFPVRLHCGAGLNLADHLRATKEYLRHLPRSGFGYGLLRYRGDAPTRALLAGAAAPRMAFNYLGQLGQTTQTGDLFTVLAPNEMLGPDEPAYASWPLSLVAHIADGRLALDWSFCAEVLSRGEVDQLAQAFLAELEALTDHATSTVGAYSPSDFPLANLDQAALDQLLPQRGMVDDLYPLSPMQAGMLFHTGEAGPAYFEQFGGTLVGNLDLERFQQAWSLVTQRHEILRASVVATPSGDSLLRIAPSLEPLWQFHDLSTLAETEQAARIEEILLRDRAEAIDPCQAPLWRLTLLRLGDRRNRLVWSHHHMIMDGWSMPILFRDLFDTYEALGRGESISMDQATPYRRYIEWLAARDRVAEETFWRSTLAGFSEPTRLAMDRGLHAEKPGSTHRRIEARIDEATTALLTEFARTHELTLNSMVQGAWSLLLSRYSGSNDVLFGATVTHRPAEIPGVDQMVGLFLNTQPVRVQIDAESVLSWLKRLRDDATARQAYSGTPLLEFKTWSEVPGQLPLFDSLLVFENFPIDRAFSEAGRYSLELDEMASFEQTNFPLTFSVEPGPHIVLGLRYDPNRFDPADMTQVPLHFRNLLLAMIDHTDHAPDDLSLSDEASRAALLARFDETEGPYPGQHSIVTQFLKQVGQTPSAEALLDHDGQALSYAQLLERASHLAAQLQARGVRNETPVGVYMARCPEAVIAFLAILMAGGAYLPLDPSFPSERLRLMMEDARAQSMILGPDRDPPEELVFPVIRLAPMGLCETPTLPFAQPVIEPQSLAYIMYTSGSSGRPKGVSITHRGVLRLVCNNPFWHVSPGRRVAHLANIAFDAASLEIWGSLLGGATLVVVPPALTVDPTGLMALLDAHAVEVVHFTSALFDALIREMPDALAHFDTVLFGGEAATPEWVARCLAHGRPKLLHHLYGPTENTVISTWYPVEQADPAHALPIGGAIANCFVLIVDGKGRPLPHGLPGELLLGGPGLARGYLGKAGQTAAAFIPSCLSKQAGERLYRSGDRVRYLPDGNLQFLGRIDAQVKLRGFRIEPGEIERTLCSLPWCEEARVLVREVGGNRQLIAYYIGDEQSTPGNELESRLPAYMVPAHYIKISSWPMTANGKFDPARLPLPEQASEKIYRAPENATQAALVPIWQEVLGHEPIGIDDHFFELGGHSLLVARLLARINQTFACNLPPRAVFEAPTIALLAERIDKQQASHGLPPLVSVPRGPEMPLSHTQLRMWFLARWQDQGAAYIIPSIFMLSGSPDVALLERVLIDLTERHEILRTRFPDRDGQPFLAFDPPGHVVGLVDLSQLADKQQTVEDLVARELQRPFDLEHGPLFRTTLLRLSPDQHLLMLCMHHITSDGWSMGLLVEELIGLYGAGLRGEPSHLAPLPVQYADYAAWQQAWPTELLEGQLAWWAEHLAGAPALLNLPVDRPRPSSMSRGAVVEFAIATPLSEQLADLGRTHGATPFMVLLAAFKLLLARYSGQDDLVVGTPVANRRLPETETLIGFFANTLAPRTQIDRRGDFFALLDRVKQSTLDAFSHADAPFEKLVADLQPERNPSVNPIFQVMFALQNLPAASFSLPTLQLQPQAFSHQFSRFDLTLALSESGQGLHGHLEYSRDLFDATRMVRLTRHYLNLLDAILTNPKQPVGELQLMSATERETVLHSFNQAEVAFPKEQTLHDRFFEWARRAPEDIAIIEPTGNEISYGILAQRVSTLASWLVSQGVKGEHVVAVAMERGFAATTAFLAIMKAGGAFMPLDRTLPVARLRFMIEDTRARVLLTESESDDLEETGCIRLALTENWWSRITGQTPLPERKISACSLSNIIFTSGSTGTPKGVAVTHRGIMRFMDWPGYLDVQPGDRVGHVFNIAFDGTGLDIWPALLHGGTLVVIDRETAVDANQLYRFLVQHRIDIISFPTALFHHLITVVPHALRDVRVVCLGGEAAPSVSVARCQAEGPPAKLINIYGPTENSVISSYYDLTHHTDPIIPIGTPIPNTTAHVIDPFGEVQPLGIAGELWLGGPGLARGYLGRPALTASVFVPDPFSAVAGQRLYRSGDLVIRREDGDLLFLGRMDHQVKLRGLRVELGEIERQLLAHEQVNDARVLVRDIEGVQNLVAYVIEDGDGDLLEYDSLRQLLRDNLPSYMVPSHFVGLASWPLTPNGKVDNRRLPLPDLKHTSRAFSPPRNPLEAALVTIWQEVLAREPISVFDDFFDLGGHSLLATQVISRIRELFGVTLSPRFLFEEPTIAAIAGHIEHLRAALSAPSDEDNDDEREEFDL